MILDLRLNTDCLKAESYLAKLIKAGNAIELKKIPKKRTNKQNRYVHALFTLYGGEWGLTMDETKTVVKRELGYIYEKHGQKFLMHTSQMDTKKLTEFIDRFRNMSASQGLYLPSADEFNENYVEIMKVVEYVEATQKRYGY